jgi:hypothetical protein
MASPLRQLWIVCVLIGSGLTAGAQQFDLPLLGRTALNIFSAMTFYEQENTLLTGGISETRNRLVRIDLADGAVTEYFEIHRFLGAAGDRVLVSTMNRDHVMNLLFVDPVTLERSAGPGWPVSIDWALLPGPDGAVYSASLDSRGVYAPFLFDLQSRRQSFLDVRGVPTSLTADTLHLLIHDPDTGEVVIWSTEEQAPHGRLRSGAPAGQVRFLTNSLLMLPPPYLGQHGWRLFDMTGRQVGEVQFRIPLGDPLFFWFARDLRRAVVCLRGRVNPETAVVNTESFRRWLQSQDFLFVTTSGVLNADRVRVRARPTLGAEVLGHLNRGDHVQVLDRSGLRARIESMNDFWYLVRSAEGLSGWSYGRFIDLEQP